MSLADDVRRLSTLSPFSALPREAVQIVAFSSQRVKVKAGDKLFVGQGKTDGGYFVFSGAVELRSGARMRRIEAGALIGDLSLIAEVERRYEASALEDSELLKIPRDVFRRVLDEFPTAKREISLALRRRATTVAIPLAQLDKRYFAAESKTLAKPPVESGGAAAGQSS